MIYLGYEDLNTYGSSEVYYEPITLAEIVSLDPYADSVYGRPVEITELFTANGTIIPMISNST